MRVQVIARNLGLVLLVNALFMGLSLFVSAINGFDTGFSPLLLSAIITATIGSFPYIFVKKAEDVRTQEGYMIVILSWALACLFGMLPYVLWGGEFSLSNAWYESVSGYTTTGGTILQDVESLPHSLLFWRASTHFIGGMGVVMFMLLILPEVSTIRLRLSKIELSSLSQDHYRFRTKETVRIIAYVYFGLAVTQTICLMIAGMSFFDAVCHAFSTVSTGGFSTRNMSIASFNNVWIEIIVNVFMCLSAMHFGMIYLFVTGRSFALFRSPVTRFYLSTIAVATVAITISLWYTGTFDSLWTSLRHASFQAVSFMTTTGFATCNSAIWPQFTILLLIWLAIQCGCSGSTTGGMKTDRILISFYSIRAQLTKRLHPKSVVPVRIGGQPVDPEQVAGVNLFIVFYLACAIICALLLSINQETGLVESLTVSLSHIGNVGPAFGKYGSLDNYHMLDSFSKFLLTIEMIVGRIELFGFFLLFGSRK